MENVWWCATFILSILCATVGIIGNSFTIATFVKFPKFRNPVGSFILSLTIVDLVGCFVVIPLHAPFFYNEGHWKLGLGLCKVAKFASYGCFATSGITVALVAINRCIKVSASAELYERLYTLKGISVMHALNWGFPFFLMALISIGVGGRIYIDDESEVCAMEGKECWLPLMVTYGLVLITIIVCYTKIYCTARNSSRNCQRMSSAQIMKKYRSSERLLKMLLATTIMFVICFSPGPIIGTVYGNGNAKLKEPSLNFFFYSAYYVSLFLNPIIYGAMNNQYRKAYKSIFFQIFRINPNNRTSVGSTGCAKHRVSSTQSSQPL